jgi:hypothetical protein
MIYLITGANGAGKSLKAVQIIRDILKANANPKALNYDEWIQQYEEDDDGYLMPIVVDPQPLKRPIFSNIPGLNFDSDQVYTLPKSGMYDWSEFPKGSVIFDDECHRRIPATGKPGAHGDPHVDKLDMHRHSGLDFYFMTQFPNKLHHVVRNLVSKHFHLQNMAGSKNASIFTWQYAETNPNDYAARQGADTNVFHYDKSLFKHYKSSSMHTHKLKVPAKMWVLVAIFSVAFLNLARSLASDDETLLNHSETSQNIDIVERAQSDRLAPAGVLSTTYSGCISTAYQCICYDDQYQPIDLDLAECKNKLEEPLKTVPIIAKTGA